MSEITEADIRDALEASVHGSVEFRDDVDVPSRSPDHVLCYSFEETDDGVEVASQTHVESRGDAPTDATLVAPVWVLDDGIAYRIEPREGTPDA